MAVKKKFPYRSAFVACNGGCHVTEGSSCSYGCIACGKCVESCKFGAIHLNEHGIAEVDEEKCIACGRCVRECPQHIIHLHDCANTIVVKCSNKDKGKDAKTVCSVSCIGCGICEKNLYCQCDPCRRQLCSDRRSFLLKLRNVCCKMSTACDL